MQSQYTGGGQSNIGSIEKKKYIFYDVSIHPWFSLSWKKDKWVLIKNRTSGEYYLEG